MFFHRLGQFVIMAGAAGTLAACGSGFASGDSGLFNRSAPTVTAVGQQDTNAQPVTREQALEPESSIFDLFSNSADPNTTVEVNKYLWQASLEILNFLPIETVDPFTGVISTGFGTPPGGGRAYRATVYVQDPALDARSLRVALQARGGGAVNTDTARSIEDAILTRARQLRIRDSNL